MKIKSRGESRRVTISFTEETYAELRKQSDKLGYSLAEIARRVIDRGVVDDVVRVTQAEYREQLYEKICRLHERRIEGLQDAAKEYAALNAKLEQEVVDYLGVIADGVEMVMRRDKEIEELRARKDA